jgi:hypothetical protein
MVEALQNKLYFTDEGAVHCIMLPREIVAACPDTGKLLLHGLGIWLAEAYQESHQLLGLLDEALEMAATYRVYQDDTAREVWPPERCAGLVKRAKEARGE